MEQKFFYAVRANRLFWDSEFPYEMLSGHAVRANIYLYMVYYRNAVRANSAKRKKIQKNTHVFYMEVTKDPDLGMLSGHILSKNIAVRAIHISIVDILLSLIIVQNIMNITIQVN